jgi:hypothetical protein
MSDDVDIRMAELGRALAQKLIIFARERRDEDRKHVAQLHTELCELYREEQAAKHQCEQAEEIQ